MYLGSSGTGSANVLVTGNSVLNPLLAYVGYVAAGSVTVNNGSSFNVPGGEIIGFGGPGSVLLDGLNTTGDTFGQILDVGEHAAGRLTMQNGAGQNCGGAEIG